LQSNSKSTTRVSPALHGPSFSFSESVLGADTLPFHPGPIMIPTTGSGHSGIEADGLANARVSPLCNKASPVLAAFQRLDCE
jgi:hypothetical protein